MSFKSRKGEIKIGTEKNFRNQNISFHNQCNVNVSGVVLSLYV